MHLKESKLGGTKIERGLARLEQCDSTIASPLHPFSLWQTDRQGSKASDPLWNGLAPDPTYKRKPDPKICPWKIYTSFWQLGNRCFLKWTFYIKYWNKKKISGKYCSKHFSTRFLQWFNSSMMDVFHVCFFSSCVLICCLEYSFFIIFRN